MLNKCDITCCATLTVQVLAYIYIAYKHFSYGNSLVSVF